jgi:hypothetical protein
MATDLQGDETIAGKISSALDAADEAAGPISLGLEIAGGENALVAGMKAAYSTALGGAFGEAMAEAAGCAEDGDAGPLVCGAAYVFGWFTGGSVGNDIGAQLGPELLALPAVGPSNLV